MTNEEFLQSITLPGEEWRDVVGYEGYYVVSSFGRIASIRGYYQYTKNGKTFIRKNPPHICSTKSIANNYYYTMTFRVNYGHETKYVHRIVAEAFVPNPNNYNVIDHIDDNPHNNRADNLQWCTYSINNSKTHHRINSSISHRGQIAYNKTPVVQLKNGQYVATFSSMCDAERLGFNHSAIHRVCNGKLKTHGGFRWMYLSDYESLISKSKNSEPNS